MIEAIIFVPGSAVILWYSITSLHQAGSHGFYRFFAWEFILGMLVINLRTWFVQPFAWYQIISWILLFLSLFPLFAGLQALHSQGKPSGSFEATTQLADHGIYHLIRHPLYASLLYLAWGLLFKSPSLIDGCGVVVATTFLFATARADEAECMVKFGQPYADYMKKTRMFIPFVF
jgi:protein-S-isoprenylcysteine O-methyltransferase Ste14